MSNKRSKKRKFFTLIEVLVAISILSIILSFGLSMLAQQMKSQIKIQKGLQNFYRRTELLQSIQEIFFKLACFEKKCLVSKDDNIFITYDAGVTKEAAFSGVIQANIYEKNHKLIIEKKTTAGNSNAQVLIENIKSISIYFYSQKYGWQTDWFSEDMGLPEMIHVKCDTQEFKIDQKFLLPFNLVPINISCKSSHLSFL